MLSIRDSAAMQRALSGPLDPDLRTILVDRLALLFPEFSDWALAELAQFEIVEPGDSIDVIEEELGFSPFVNFVDGARYPDPAFTPSWEWLTARGSWIDVTFALSDSGFGIVLLVPDIDGVDPELLALFKSYIGYRLRPMLAKRLSSSSVSKGAVTTPIR